MGAFVTEVTSRFADSGGRKTSMAPGDVDGRDERRVVTASLAKGNIECLIRVKFILAFACRLLATELSNLGF